MNAFNAPILATFSPIVSSAILYVADNHALAKNIHAPIAPFNLTSRRVDAPIAKVSSPSSINNISNKVAYNTENKEVIVLAVFTLYKVQCSNLA